MLDRLDGLLVPGSPSNVHPSHYGGGDSQTPELHDPARDATTLPLIRAAIARGLPVLAICRGIQELNVALGGTLHQQVHDIEGRLDHRGGAGPIEQRYGPKHPIAVTGELARIVGADAIMVNSLHGQAIDRPATGWWSRRWPRTARSRPSACRRVKRRGKQRAAVSPSACNGIPNGTGRKTPPVPPLPGVRRGVPGVSLGEESKAA